MNVPMGNWNLFRRRIEIRSIFSRQDTNKSILFHTTTETSSSFRTKFSRHHSALALVVWSMTWSRASHMLRLLQVQTYVMWCIRAKWEKAFQLSSKEFCRKAAKECFNSRTHVQCHSAIHQRWITRYRYCEITRLHRQVMKMKDLIIPAEKLNIQYQAYYWINKGQFGNFCYSESCTHKTNVINSRQTPAKPWSFTDWATSLTTWKHHNTKRFSIKNTVPCVFTYHPHQVKSMKEKNFS